MKKHLCLLLGTTCLVITTLQAQNWVNGGNTLSANGTLGTNSNHSVIFETVNASRGILTNTGLWHLGGTSTPAAKVQISHNSVAGNSPHLLLYESANDYARLYFKNTNTTNYFGIAGLPATSNAASRLNFLYSAVGDILTIQGDKKVGIGTTAPAQQLHVVGNTYITGNLGIGTASPSYKLQVVGNASISNGLDVAGNVGIGTAAPAKKLQVQDGDVRILTTSTSSRYLELVSPGPRIDWRFGHVGNFFDIYSSPDDFATSYLRAYFEHATSPSFVFHVLGRSVGNEWVVSDARLKKDVQGLENSMSLIKRLQPKTYYFKSTEFAGLGLPSEKQYGLIAQELEEVLPELVANTEITVKVDANGERQKEKVKVINYTEIIPLLVKAMQEQDQRMEQLQQQIEIQAQHNDELKKELAELKQLISQVTNAPKISTSNSGSTLLQNTPNPARDITQVTYSLPDGMTRAQLLITDALGRSIRQFSLGTSGSIKIDVSSLAKGVYHYSLIIDNKTMITKKMTVVK